jgi:hypothetical protein
VGRRSCRESERDGRIATDPDQTNSPRWGVRTKVKRTNLKLLRALMLAGVVSVPLALGGCLSSSSGDGGVIDDDDNGLVDDDDNGIVDDDDNGDGGETAVQVDFMEGAPEVDWGEARTVTAFVPGVRSWQWVTGPHGGAGSVNNGGRCTSCHGTFLPGPEGLGASLLSDGEDPIEDRPGHIDITLQAAYDADKFYLKASWETDRPGITHDIFTYQDGAWVRNSHERPEPLEEGEVYSREDRIGVMFAPVTTIVPAAEGASANFNTAGCWITCHGDLEDMPDEADHDLYTLDEEITKYLKISRVAGGGATDELTDISALQAAGQFPDMWHFRGARSAALQTLTDGYVLEKRASDSGAHPYATNTAGEGGWMYDADWMEAEYGVRANGFPAELWAELGDNAPPLIRGVNAVEFDPTAAFTEGDIIPRRVLDASFAADNSRNDVAAYSSWEDGTWTVIFERDLVTGNADDHALDGIANNQTYTFAFSIFADHTGGRYHYVSFPTTIGMVGADADIEARGN